MTFGIDPSPASSSSPSGNSLTFAYTCPAGSNLLMVPCGIGAPTTDITGVTYNGVSLSLVGVQSNAVWSESYLWKLDNPPTGASYDVVITVDMTAQVAGCAVALTDANLTLGTPVGATASTPNPSVTLSTTAGDIVVAMHWSDGGSVSTLSATSPGVALFVVNNLAADSNCGAQYVTATGTSTTVNWTESDTDGFWSGIAVAISAGGPAPQFSRPNADVSDGSWTPSTGADNYAVLDETSYSDTDYSSVNSNSTLRVGLSSISTPDSGTRTLRYRAAGSPEKKLIVRLIENTTTKETFTTDPITSTITAYSQTVTASISNYADLDVEFEIADATSPPTLQVTWGAVGTAGSGTTSCTPAYPTGISALTSKLYCMVTGRSNTANTAPTMPAGWTSIGALEGGTGTWGIDTGTRRVDLFVKNTVTGSETGTVTVSLGGTTANTLRASIFRVEVPSGYGITESVGTGADSSNDTSYSATSGTSLPFAPNDLLVVGTAQNLDTGTGTSAFSATSITFDTVTRRANTAVTNGNDHRHILATASVTAGTATSAPVHSYTVSAAASGPSLFARMRAVAPTEKGRVTWVEFETPASSGGTHAGTESESATASDSQSAQWDAKATNADTFTASETNAGSVAFAGTEAETLTASDAQTGAIAVDGAESESVTATDSQSASATTAGAEAESLTASDAQAAQWNTSGAESETLSAADSQSGSATRAGAEVETLTAADSSAASAVTAGAEAEALTASDSQSTAATFAAAQSESFTASEATDATLESGTASATNESLSAGDSQSAQWTANAAAAESLTTSDAQAGQRMTAGAESDSVTATDAQTGARLIETAQAETATAADGQAAQATYVAASADALTLAESTDADFGGVLAGSVAEALTLTDTQTAELVGEVIASGGGGAWHIRPAKKKAPVAPAIWVATASEFITAVDAQDAQFDGATLERYRRLARRRKDETELLLMAA